MYELFYMKTLLYMKNIQIIDKIFNPFTISNKSTHESNIISFSQVNFGDIS